MKYSRFNIAIPSGSKVFVNNSKTDYFVQVEQQLADLFNQCETDPEQLHCKAPDFYNHLLEHGFIVSDDTDETSEIIHKWEEEDNSQTVMHITVNPTLNCNLRCWYCYEEHNANTLMTEDTITSVLNLFKQSFAQDRYKEYQLSFFGGEPLMCFNNVVKPLLNQLSQIKPALKQVSLHFTTNSTLLSDGMLDFLKPWAPSFQITIDGNEFIHNMVKTIANRSAYNVALTNIRKILSNGLKVGIRLNYTAKTLKTFIDVLSDIKSFTDDEKNFCNISFHRIWQDNKVPDTELDAQLNELENHFREAGFYVISHSSNVTGRCYADKPNNITINYDGSIYMCTAREFNAENSEGILNPDGTIVRNERYNKRMAIRLGNPQCQHCIIYPLCHGGCSQHKLESNITDGCYKGYTEQDKIDFATKRIRDIINEHNTTI